MIIIIFLKKNVKKRRYIGLLARIVAIYTNKKAGYNSQSYDKDSKLLLINWGQIKIID